MKFTITPSRIVINFIDITNSETQKNPIDYNTLFSNLSIYRDNTNIVNTLKSAHSDLNIACNTTETIINSNSNDENTIGSETELESAINKFDEHNNPSSQIAIEIKKIEDINQYRN
jgi:hypothetical protein